MPLGVLQIHSKMKTTTTRPAYATPRDLENGDKATIRKALAIVSSSQNALHELPPPCGSECNQDAHGG